MKSFLEGQQQASGQAYDRRFLSLRDGTSRCAIGARPARLLRLASQPHRGAGRPRSRTHARHRVRGRPPPRRVPRAPAAPRECSAAAARSAAAPPADWADWLGATGGGVGSGRLGGSVGGGMRGSEMALPRAEVRHREWLRCGRAVGSTSACRNDWATISHCSVRYRDATGRRHSLGAAFWHGGCPGRGMKSALLAVIAVMVGCAAEGKSPPDDGHGAGSAGTAGTSSGAAGSSGAAAAGSGGQGPGGSSTGGSGAGVGGSTACGGSCAGDEVCCLDAHGHNPTCTKGSTCP